MIGSDQGPSSGARKSARGLGLALALLSAVGIAGLARTPGPIPTLILFSGFTAITLLRAVRIASAIWRAGGRR